MIQKATEGRNDELEQESKDALGRLLEYAKKHNIWGRLTVTATIEGGRITVVETDLHETKK